jgi:purine-binding chemotaxis protein CheW
MQAVVFGLDGQRFALRLSAVQRVVRAVAVTPLPGAPPVVLGAIDVAGSIVPVIDVRRRLSPASHEVRASDQFLIATTARRSVALLIDEAHGVIEHEPSAVVDAARIAPGLERFHGVVQLEDGLVLIHDLDAFLSLDEARALDESMQRDKPC